jgi:hypothetical protein
MRFVLISLLSALCLSAAPYSMEIGATTTRYDYTETVDSVVIDTERSDPIEVHGIYARFEAALRQNSWGGEDRLRLSWAYSSGNTEYVGSLIGSGEGYGSYRSTTHNRFREYGLDYLRNFERQKFGFLLSAGAGYYEWERALSASQVERYHWYFAQIAAGMSYPVYRQCRLGVEIGARYGIDPGMDAHVPGLGTRTFTLGHVMTNRIDASLGLPLTEAVSFRGGIRYEQTDIGRSNVIGGFYEPDSIQKNWYVYGGLKLAF